VIRQHHVHRFFAPGILLLGWMLSAPLAAQNDPELEQILFEAVPLPAPTTDQASRGLERFMQVPEQRNSLSGRPPPRSDAAETDRAIALYQEAIAAEEAANGPFAAGQLESFLQLGQLYQQLGDHEAALEALGKAEYISRINSGLFAPEQIVIVEAMVRSYFATGALAQANEKQQYLVFIQQQFFGEDSLEVVPALKNLGNWNMDAFRSMLNQHNASGFQLGLNTRAGGTSSTPNPRVLAFGNLFTAQRSYYQAIVNLVQQRQFRDPLLPQLELQLIEAIFLGANREAILENPEFYLGRRGTYTGSRIIRSGLNSNSLSFANGRNAWTRMRIYLENDPSASAVEVAATIIGLGDWHMLFNRRTSALGLYREARSYLQEHQVEDSMIDALLSPAVPQQLPAFTPLPHSRGKFGIEADTPLDYDGYLDLSFSISRYGNIRDLKVLATSDNVDKRMERRLKRLLHSSPFRPRLVDGDTLDEKPLTLRYYFAVIDR